MTSAHTGMQHPYGQPPKPRKSRKIPIIIGVIIAIAIIAGLFQALGLKPTPAASPAPTAAVSPTPSQAPDLTTQVKEASPDHADVITAATETEPGRIEIATSLVDPRTDNSPAEQRALAICRDITTALTPEYLTVNEEDRTIWVVYGHPRYGKECTAI